MGSFFSYLVFSKCVKAPLAFDSAPLAGGSGVASESAFAGDDCSGPEEKSVSIVFCGVRGCSKEGLRIGCGCGSFVGESKKLAEPSYIPSSVDILKNLFLEQCILTLLAGKAFCELAIFGRSLGKWRVFTHWTLSVCPLEVHRTLVGAKSFIESSHVLRGG